MIQRPPDWTEKDGRSNSSDLYVELSNEIGQIIRDSAHSLLAGQSNDVGRLILSRLAHTHGFAPIYNNAPINC